MTREVFIEKLEALELTQKEFASLIGYSYQAVKQWRDQTIPPWVPLVLDHFEILRNNVRLAKKYGF